MRKQQWCNIIKTVDFFNLLLIRQSLQHGYPIPEIGKSLLQP